MIKKMPRMLGVFVAIIAIASICIVFFGEQPVNIAEAASYESESNNSMSSANSISLNSYINGNISSSSDVDWYKFTTNYDGYFSITFSHSYLSSSSTYWRIYLYNSSGSSIDGVSNSYFGVSGNETSYTTNRFGVPAGTYYVKITSGNYRSDYSYSLCVNYTSSSGWETENNSNMSNADQIELNQTVNGALAFSGDIDWFKFTVDRSASFSVSFKHSELSSSSTYWRIYVYDENGSSIDGSSTYQPVYGNDYFTTTCQYGVSRGTYYIKITEGNYRSGMDYQLIVNVTYSSSYEKWETENNNTKDSADLCNSNVSIYGALSYQNDVDWYKIGVGQGSQHGYITINFEHDELSSSSTYWRIYLYDKYGETLDGSSTYYAVRGNENFSSCKIGLKANIYYIKITTGNYYSDKTYKLTVNFTAASDWETENNKDSADRIELNKPIKGTLMTENDIDWFYFELNTGCEVAFVFNHEVLSSSSSYWTYYVVDDSSSRVYSMNRRGDTASSTSDYMYLSAGEYYIQVKTASYYSNAEYSLCVMEKHDHCGEWSYSVAPTCEASGTETRTCEICGTIETREVSPTGHHYESTTIKNASLTEKGEVVYCCVDCGASYTEEPIAKWWILIIGCIYGVQALVGLGFLIAKMINGED